MSAQQHWTPEANQAFKKCKKEMDTTASLATPVHWLHNCRSCHNPSVNILSKAKMKSWQVPVGTRLLFGEFYGPTWPYRTHTRAWWRPLLLVSTTSFDLCHHIWHQRDGTTYWMFYFHRNNMLRSILPIDLTGTCASVQQSCHVYWLQWHQILIGLDLNDQCDNVPRAIRVDAIGIPRGVPDEFKDRNMTSAGFEAVLIWSSPNKNAERINYLYYSQQRFVNYTGISWDDTNLMAWQNRLALDRTLTERGGACKLIEGFCCVYLLALPFAFQQLFYVVGILCLTWRLTWVATENGASSKVVNVLKLICYPKEYFWTITPRILVMASSSHSERKASMSQL